MDLSIGDDTCLDVTIHVVLYNGKGRIAQQVEELDNAFRSFEEVGGVHA